MAPSVLVLGGTSFFGKEIVTQLLDAGYRLSVLSRGNQRPEFLARVTHIQADRNDRRAFAAALRGKTFDAVVDNIGYTGEDVCAALEVLAGNVGRYLFTSTAAVYYTGTMAMPVVEDDVDLTFHPPASEVDTPLWRYTLGKLGGERALRDQDRVPYVVLRPPVVLGPDDGSLRGYFYLQRLLDGGPLLLTHGGVQSFRLVYSKDLARGYRLALADKRALGQTYNLVQPEVVRLCDLIEAAAKALGVTPDLEPVSREALTRAGLEYPETYAGMTNFLPDGLKAQRELGFSTTPFTQWVTQTAHWYRDVYRGKDSAGYERRAQEMAFVRTRREKKAAL